VAAVEHERPALVASDELAQANRLRAQRRWQQAATAYASAAAHAPGSEAARVATVARAALLLERLSRPAEALALFHAVAARADGSLAEEARYGIAQSHRALGDRAAERAAWELFIAEHPASPLRPGAESRLTELGRSPR
jgi:hypothetical protein